MSYFGGRVLNHSMLLFLPFMLWATSCRGQSDARPLTIAAAASHAAAFEELGPAFTAETGIPVQVVYASTGHLSQQIRNGAPYDLFAAADIRHVEALVTEELTLTNPVAFAEGRLVLVASQDNSRIGQWDPGLFEFETDRISIANPLHAPYGLAAKETLVELDLWSELQHRIVYGESVRQALQIVESGNAKFGLVAGSLINEGAYTTVEIPPELYSPVLHSAVVLQSTNQPDIARDFIDFMLSSTGQTILVRYGFSTP